MVIFVALCLLGASSAFSNKPYAFCRTAFNCSYNGDCLNGACVCGPGWTGKFCHVLDLAPAFNGSGLNQLNDKKISTWGGSVLRHDDGKYHMWASEISRHCGIHRWTTNSVIVHAISNGPPNWKFDRKEEVFPLFSHEPIVSRAPTGEYVMYFTSYPGSVADCPTCNCTDGNSVSGESGCGGECGCGKKKTMYSYFSFAKDPNGPWSKKVSLQNVQPGLNRTDLNLAPVILKQGHVVAWTRWDIWEATKWNDPSTYKDMGQAPDWSHGGIWEGEDPSVWVDKNGHFHSISHNGARGKSGEKGDCGRHLFSTNGKAGTWMPAPLPKEDLGGCVYPRVNITFKDGSIRSFYRRERPHLVFGPDGYTPVALTTAVIDSPLGPGMPGYHPPQRDASYTLLQPINQRA